MHLTINILINYLLILIAIAFFTLLERKLLGYIQLRKGPNKVSLIGLPQPFADAIKLFTKEFPFPTKSNIIIFVIRPVLGLILAILLWSIYPYLSSRNSIQFGVLFFICVSRLNVYTTLVSGWASNSKYSLIGAIRRIAQTISYEIRISLILINILIFLSSFNLTEINSQQILSIAILCPPLFILWFISTLAETNRTPFDLSEGESELVSGFNIEYRAGGFALLFIAEYTNILFIRILSGILFFSTFKFLLIRDLILVGLILFFAFTAIWIRRTLPRIRYDILINLTWKSFLPFTLTLLILTVRLNALV